MTSGQTIAVNIEAVRKVYGNFTAVHGIDLTVEKGELVTLLGPSGCGKTTVLRMIAGFARPTSGRIAIAGTTVNDLPPHKRQVGLVFQNYALFPHMTVGDNVAFGLKMRRVPRGEIQERVTEALRSVRLAERIDAYPRQLSGGQQQRVALARALVTKPDVLLLDEPFGALDRELRQHLQGEMKRLQRSLGISTLLVTHDQEEALMLSDRVVVLKSGRVEQTGPAAEVFERPRTRFVAEFMGRANLFDGCIRERPGSGGLEFVLSEDQGVIPLPPGCALQGGNGVIMIRPEHVHVSGPDAAGSAHTSTAPLDGRIAEVNYLGATTAYTIAISPNAKFTLVARVASTLAGAPPLGINALVRVTVPREAVHVIG